MVKDWKAITDEYSTLLKEVRSGAPEVTRGFSGLARAALAEGALSPKQKELMAVAVSVAVRCDACIGFHVQAAVRHGATREEMLETVGLSVYMGGGPSFMYGSQALEAYDQFCDSGTSGTA